MQVLGMPGSGFKVDLPKKTLGVHYNGNESVDFLVQTNMGSDFKALKKVASGGELSRISLAISVVSSDNEYTPTLIFDEVDVGISGAVDPECFLRQINFKSTARHTEDLHCFGDQV
jgi:DNA repair protein RecN (Recombination protein N)